jgi:hypothetical protein
MFINQDPVYASAREGDLLGVLSETLCLITAAVFCDSVGST